MPATVSLQMTGPQKPARRVPLAAAVALGMSLMVTACATTPDGGATQSAGQANMTEALWRLAASSEAQGDYSLAADRYGKLMERSPDDIEAITGRARNLRYLQKVGDSRKLLSDSIARLGPAYALRLELAKATMAGPTWKDAKPMIDELMAEQPSDWRPVSLHGLASDRSGDFAGAQKDYRAVLKMNPDNLPTLNNLALSLAMSGNLDEAVGLLETVQDRSDAPLQLRQNLAMFYALRGQMGKAEALVRASLPEDAAKEMLQALRSMSNAAN